MSDTLREIARTAPYMHDGRFKTLEEVVEFYNQGGIKNHHQDNTIIRLELTPSRRSRIWSRCFGRSMAKGGNMLPRRRCFQVTTFRPV